MIHKKASYVYLMVLCSNLVFAGNEFTLSTTETPNQSSRYELKKRTESDMNINLGECFSDLQSAVNSVQQSVLQSKGKDKISGFMDYLKEQGVEPIEPEISVKFLNVNKYYKFSRCPRGMFSGINVQTFTIYSKNFQPEVYEIFSDAFGDPALQSSKIDSLDIRNKDQLCYEWFTKMFSNNPRLIYGTNLSGNIVDQRCRLRNYMYMNLKK